MLSNIPKFSYKNLSLNNFEFSRFSERLSSSLR